ncbi:DoxX family protein [Halalkalibaculum sp. DA3122]|uniref:DoxX family protein n=1 Tax=unclassified Halalkalibaculum TaxID=2964617 RepID=UPI0037540954
MMRSRRSGKYRNVGLLLLRIGLGIAFIFHGLPKVFGGPEAWTAYGTAMQYLGIDAAPMFFGFIAGITELFGGIFLMLGLFYRPILVMLTLTMLVAMASKIGEGAGYPEIAHPMKMAIVFFSMIFIGPGKYSLENRLNKRRRLF